MSRKSTPATEGSRMMPNPFYSEVITDMGSTEERGTQVSEPLTQQPEEEKTVRFPEGDVHTQIKNRRKEGREKKDILEIFTSFLQENSKTVLDIDESDLIGFLSETMRFDDRVIALAQNNSLFTEFFGYRASVISGNDFFDTPENKKNMISGLLRSLLSRLENLNTEFTEKMKKLESYKVKFGRFFNEELDEKFSGVEVGVGGMGMSRHLTNLKGVLTDAFVESYKKAKEQQVEEELDISKFVQAFLSYFETSVFCENYKAEYTISKLDLLTRLTLKAATAK